MRWSRLLTILLLVVPTVLAEGLPDLGDSSQSSFSALEERRLGEEIMREMRADRTYYDDAESTEYLNSLGTRLTSRKPPTRVRSSTSS